MVIVKGDSTERAWYDDEEGDTRYAPTSARDSSLNANSGEHNQTGDRDR
jgi:hypothetical protein